MASRTDIFNQAVALIKAKAIQSPDEASLEARECRRFYPQIISEMAQGPHDWSFLNRRVALALSSNDRENEWLYAYQVPSDMGGAIRIIPDLEASGLVYPVPLPGIPYAQLWASAGYEGRFIIENGTIYTNVENGTLEYATNDVSESALPGLVVNAIVVDLAARIAVPVKGDYKKRRELLQEADLHWQRAMADDQNRHPQRQGEFISETQIVRAGWFTPWLV